MNLKEIIELYEIVNQDFYELKAKYEKLRVNTINEINKLLDLELLLLEFSNLRLVLKMILKKEFNYKI